MRRLTLFLLGLLILLPACAKKRTQSKSKVQTYGVAFYNLENLFDTKHDEGKNDEDYLPGGKNQWTEERYHSKLRNMSRVLGDICPDASSGHATVIGVAEVENRGVMLDLLAQPALRELHYRVLHYESPDRRGIDCAMIYDPQRFTLTDSLYVPYIYPSRKNPEDRLGFRVDANGRVVARPLFGDTSHTTRGFLVGIGRMAGQQVAIIVCHWPSRGSESDTRERAGSQVKALKNALQTQYPGLSVIIMGDLNDDPDNRSLSRSLGCRYVPQEAAGQNHELYNPWRYVLREEDRGTLTFRGQWNLFDQILVSGDLVSKKMEVGQPLPKSEKGGKSLQLLSYDIFKPGYIVQQSGNYKGTPLRTMAGERWMNGYSDHFPTYIYLVK